MLATEISPSTDQILLAIKLEIDQLSISTSKLSEFLDWVNQKAVAVSAEVDNSLTPLMIRAFYFEKCLLFMLGRQGLMRRAGFEGLHLRNTMTLDSTIIGYLFSGAAWIGGPSYNSGEVESEATDFTERFDINACQNAHEVSLKKILEELRDRLPIFDGSLNNYFSWWAQNGSVWLTNLNKVIEYRNIKLINGKQLTEEQKQIFRHYHIINWILLKCLKSSDSANNAVKTEIEETLLLPIAEIEKREKQSSN